MLINFYCNLVLKQFLNNSWTFFVQGGCFSLKHISVHYFDGFTVTRQVLKTSSGGNVCFLSHIMEMGATWLSVLKAPKNCI